MAKGNCMVGQSGGPTSVINATLAGVIKAANAAPEIGTVYGAVNGIEGVINDATINLSERFKTSDDLKLLIHTPAAFLSSCRHRLSADDDTEYKKIFRHFEEKDIKYFFYIGGNDSMDTVDKLSKYAKKIGYDIGIIGIPKTIDNDLATTDHSPGFGSAAKYIAATMREIARDSRVYNKHTVTIVEIMGRNAGWLTAAAALARADGETAPHLIYIPEYTFSIEGFLKDLEEVSRKDQNVLIAVSEGIKTADGRYVCESSMISGEDAFGHKSLTGTSRALGDLVSNKTGAKVRSIEFSLMQRCGAHLASATDVAEAQAIGEKGVEAAIRGRSGEMMYFERVSNNPYKIEIKSANVSEVANVEKLVPKEWIDQTGQNVSPDLVNYILPLIQGECSAIYENGLPVHAIR